MAIVKRVLALADGRSLGYSENEVVSENVVLLHHGTPATSTLWDLWLSKFAEVGIRALAITRPGFGDSTRKPNLSLREGAADSHELLSALGISRFIAVGWSGGGPSSIANGLLPQCIAVHCIAGLSNYRVQGESFFEGLPEENVIELTKFASSWGEGFEHISAAVQSMQKAQEADMEGNWDDRPRFQEFKNDYKVLGDSLAATMRESTQDDGYAMADDLFRILSPWGFNFDEIVAPVHIWQGGLDLPVPPGMGRWLASIIPGAQLTFYPEETHSTIAVERRPEIFAEIMQDFKGR